MKLGVINFVESFEALLKESSTVSEQDFTSLKVSWLGKEGVIKDLFKQLREIPQDQKPAIAASLNEFKIKVETLFDDIEKSFSEKTLLEKLRKEFLDPTLPSKSTKIGRIHPITSIERKMSAILAPFGFKNVLGPEVETDYFCFDSLNIPPHHPARDLQDTFYTDTGEVLRTHTTSVQARTLKEGGLPIKIASFGKVYRNETEDASHQAMFHQFELVWLEQGLTLSNLMALITHILKSVYGKRRKVGFVPKFYPYTEPSIGAQINCSICNGTGCPACGGSGWVTIGGAGMIHRNVLIEFGYNPDEVTGFAFGLGTSRLAGQLFDIPKLKTLYDNDLRVLSKVAR
jgi:phenylalanyl-tRNA synthetase alpha chain